MIRKDLLEVSQRFGYRTIPTAERVLLDAAAIDRDGDTDISNLLDFAIELEKFENSTIVI